MDEQAPLPEDAPQFASGENVAPPKRDICVIGGGPSGLAALRVILDHPLFRSGTWRPVLFEAREAIGGVW